MYAQVNYAPDADAVAQQTYSYSGMGAVVPPEVLMAGESYARSVNEMRGLGALDLSALKPKVVPFALGAVAGVLVGYVIGRRRVMKVF